MPELSLRNGEWLEKLRGVTPLTTRSFRRLLALRLTRFVLSADDLPSLILTPCLPLAWPESSHRPPNFQGLRIYRLSLSEVRPTRQAYSDSIVEYIPNHQASSIKYLAFGI